MRGYSADAANLTPLGAQKGGEKDLCTELTPSLYRRQ
jgi:hypothetical protein